ncbi:hypothetical protein A0H77_19570 [Vibrio alginolyticus]|uniref:hypothetical protein n=1 Tax=Vibrio alginolyticus TaxID=663 RepID=UPI000798E5EB|nr:hypothetical protein [Vibrio alginolyticus]KXZ35098.1 hypothetical protein A0H77_19570 [Vibrio alginolyticus]
MEKFKNIFTTIMLSLTILFSINSFADQNVQCVSSQQMANMVGNFDKGKMVEACNGWLQKYDPKFMFWSGFVLTSDDILEHKDYLTKKGLDVDQAVKNFKDRIYAFGLTSIHFTTFFFVVFIIAGIVAMNRSGSNKSEQSKNNFYIVGSFLSIILFTVINFSSFRVYLIAETVGLHNKLIWESHDFESLELLNKNVVKAKTSGTANQINKSLASALHQDALQTQVKENLIYERMFGADIELDNNSWGKVGKYDLTGLQALTFSNECLSTKRAEMDYDSEWNFTSLVDFDLDVAVMMPESIAISSGGSTSNLECEKGYYGYPYTSTEIHGAFANATTRVFTNQFQSDMAASTSLPSDLKSTFNATLGKAQKIMEKLAENGSNANLQSEGFLLQSLAAVKQANKQNIAIEKTEMYSKMVAMHEGLIGDEILFKDLEDFSANQALILTRLGGEVYKFSLLSGFCHSENKITGECENGYKPIEEFTKETSRLVIQYNIALAKAPLDYTFAIDRASTFNQLDLSHQNEDYAKLTGVHHLGEFDLDFDGSRPALVAKANPDQLKEMQQEIIDRKLALITFLNVVDEAVYKIAEKNQGDYVDKIIAKTFSEATPTFQSVLKLDKNLINTINQFNNILNTYEDVYSINKETWDFTQPQTYFPYAAMIKNPDEEKIKIFNNQNDLKVYDASMLFDTSTIAKINSVSIKDIDYLKLLGIDDLIDTFVVGECTLKTETGKCNMSPNQLNYTFNDQLTYALVSLSSASMGLESFELFSEATGSLTKIGKGTGKFGDLIAGVGKLLKGAVGGIINSIQEPLNWIIVLIFILWLISTIMQEIGLYLTFFILIMPILDWIVLVVLLFVIPPTEALTNMYKNICSRDHVWTFEKTSKLVKEIMFVPVYWILVSVFILEALTNKFIGSAIYHTIFDNSDGTFTTQLLLTYAFAISVLAFMYIIVFKAPVKYRAISEKVINLTPTPIDNNMSAGMGMLAGKGVDIVKDSFDGVVKKRRPRNHKNDVLDSKKPKTKPKQTDSKEKPKTD